MSDARREGPRLRYRCCACGLEFATQTPGVAPCPRCQTIGRHEAAATSRSGGERDGE